MVSVEHASSGDSSQVSASPNWIRANWGLLLAAAVLVSILLLPQPSGLSLAGQRMLGVFGFAVIVWITEALDYAVSAIVISPPMAFLLGISPSLANPNALIGSAQGLTMAMSGFSNTLLVPSATARAAAVVPIMMGIILAFGVDRRTDSRGCR